MEERLQKVMAERGVASRRASEELIAAGRVKVDGKVASIGMKVDPSSARIEVDGREIAGRRERVRTVMMYKPQGVLSTMDDPFGGETVADILAAKGIRERLVPVGRLDKDSEGLLLLSNDGDLTLKLTHPRYSHEKTYIVRVAGRWSEDKLDTLRSDLVIEGYRIRPCEVEVVRLGRDNVHVLCFKLREGRKRQIRYMCSAAHLVVLSLKRVAIGGLRLDESLAPGDVRDLTAAELAILGRFFEPTVQKS